ncbi:MAG: MmoB/DmpM family protein [Burkholderiales bacterium]|nr:MmoB/DmpM family protein [Burkholderiales bacterium]MDE2454246.1 MmoB/DmpM family protein [Burkholderiales bacterium]
MSNVFIAFPSNEESRPLVEAILADNPAAQAVHSPGLVKIDAPNRLTIRRQTIEEITGRPFDLQQLHVNLITLSGHIDEDDDQFSLSWKH